MRCEKHHSDVSSSVGLCASCLRDRLLVLIEAQERASARAQRVQKDVRLSDTNPPPSTLPRSVSPYISRRKSDTSTVTTATWYQQHHHPQFLRSNPCLPDEKLIRSPQLDPNAGVIIDYNKKKKKKKNRSFSLLSRLFRSKSEVPVHDPDPVRDFKSRDASSSPPSWSSGILPRQREKQTRTSLDESTVKVHRRACRRPDRGMSPSIHSDGEHYDLGSSGYSSESSQGRKQTPRRTPARRSCPRQNHSWNVSGIAFCLSPLIRASPKPHWNRKGVPTEVVVAGGDIGLPVKPYISPASLFCKNRSRKLADFGRSNLNR